MTFREHLCLGVLLVVSNAVMVLLAWLVVGVSW